MNPYPSCWSETLAGNTRTRFSSTPILRLPMQRLSRDSAIRWSIEITNRETKNLLGSADPQCRCEKSVTRAPLMAYWSYCFVVVWFVNQFHKGKDLLLPVCPLVCKEIYHLLGYARRSTTKSFQLREFRASPANTTKTLNSVHTASRANSEAWERAKL